MATARQILTTSTLVTLGGLAAVVGGSMADDQGAEYAKVLYDTGALTFIAGGIGLIYGASRARSNSRTNPTPSPRQQYLHRRARHRYQQQLRQDDFNRAIRLTDEARRATNRQLQPGFKGFLWRRYYQIKDHLPF